MRTPVPLYRAEPALLLGGGAGVGLSKIDLAGRISMNEEEKKKIEEIIGGLKCSKGFTCAQSGFEGLCKARDIGLKSVLLCLEENPEACEFALYSGAWPDGHFCCQCPVRVHLATKVKG